MRQLLLLLGLLLPLGAQADYSQHPRVPDLLGRLQSEFGFSAVELETVRTALAAAQSLPQLVRQEQKAPEKTETWTQYSRRIDASRINDGVALLRDYAPELSRAEAEFGVPPAIIAAILGVETRYGRVTGKVRVLDALATQGFDHPTRSDFFFSELTEYFVFCRDFGYDPQQPLGSYAGAMGAAQFMPSNYRRLALDYDGDGRRDLWNLRDAIGSIAHYFRRYRPEVSWRRGEPQIVPAILRANELPAGAQVNHKTLRHYAGELMLSGIEAAVPLPENALVGLIELTLDEGGREWWLGLPNFYSVMSYNPRIFYAMSVSQLAQLIEQARAEAERAVAEPPP